MDNEAQWRRLAWGLGVDFEMRHPPKKTFCPWQIEQGPGDEMDEDLRTLNWLRLLGYRREWV